MNTPTEKAAAASRSFVTYISFGALLLGIGSVLLVYALFFAPTAAMPEFSGTTTEELSLATTSPALAASEPVRLSIPAVDIDTTFEKGLGLNEDSSIEVPDSFTEVGWYKFGPTPGELGPAVVLGHVDSYRGPAVFWSLGQLEPGEEISIDRADGRTARFVVTKLERVSQQAFPTAAVYGDIDHAGLRLITCSGIYDQGEKRYSHNLIVYAVLASEEAI